MDVRVATLSDVDAITDTIRLAFMDDPVWGRALAVPSGSIEHIDPFWRLYVVSGLRFSGVYFTGDAHAISTWTPPGESELTPDEEGELVALVNDALPPNLAADMLELFDRFDAAHPHDRPHAYLGLLATHPSHRGKGIGQQLLAANLADLDERGIPAYLESTNPANLHRYQRAGFEIAGTFTSVLDGALITTMWRDPR